MTITEREIADLNGQLPLGDHPIRYALVRPSNVEFDARVNRAPNTTAIRRMDKRGPGVVPAALGTPQLWERDDGVLVPLNGLQRITLCKTKGYNEYIVCEIHSGLVVRQAAALFRLLNYQLIVPAVEDFHKAVVEGEPEATEIDAILDALSLHVEPRPRTDGIACVQRLRSVYRGPRRKPGIRPDALDGALRALIAAYGRHPKTWHAMAIMGMGEFYWRHNDGTIEGPDRVGQKARDKYPTCEALLAGGEFWQEGAGGSKPDGIAAAIVEAYNKGRKGRKLPRWYS